MDNLSGQLLQQTISSIGVQLEEHMGGADEVLETAFPTGLPALTRATKLTNRAARVGFDWPDAAAVLDKLDEEVAELRAELPVQRKRTFFTRSTSARSN